MRWVTIAGKALISMSVGVLMYLAWALWGTALYTGQQQEELAREFDDLPTFAVSASAAPTSAAPTPAEAPPEPEGPPDSWRPRPGDPVFRMVIPAIGLKEIVVEGVGTEDLKLGPGHYPSCRKGFKPPLCTPFEEVFPGEQGRVVISGHRTTYGAPFFDVDKLKKGDLIRTETKWGNFTYVIRETRIVDPSSRVIVRPSRKAEIVLTTCNPKYSAAQRLIVFADLKPPPPKSVSAGG